MHADRVSDMTLAGAARLITGNNDKTCKSWARGGATKPQTQSTDVGPVVHLAMADVHKRTNLVVAGGGNSLGLYLVKEDERIGDLLCSYNDLYTRASHRFQSQDLATRGEAILNATKDRPHWCRPWILKPLKSATRRLWAWNSFLTKNRLAQTY